MSRNKDLLDNLYASIKASDFIEPDPLSVPKRFTKRQDIEISAFFAAILAWGNRKTIVNKTNELMNFMSEEPHDFILNHKDSDLSPFALFKHRTFNSTDCLYFIYALKSIYEQEDSLEHRFTGKSIKERITSFHLSFFSSEYAPERSRKHLANPAKGSASKRINMFLRWMVRNDAKNIDFGIWDRFDSSELMCPLDVHVRKAAMDLGLLKRKQSDWQAVEELTANLRLLNPEDPIKYDLPLFLYGLRMS